MHSLVSVIDEAVIIAHHEDTSCLEACLSREGFHVHVSRGPHSSVEASYSASIRCFANHANAWSIAASRTKPVLVVEADFVPCEGMGKLPLPFVLESDADARFGWLYSAGSILYGVDADGFPHGHGNTTVAYVLSPSAAKACIDFFDKDMRRGDPGAYRLWETQLGVYLRWERGILNHIPIYQYGEHGGISNPEHSKAGVRHWHQADILWSGLAFTPFYAGGSQLRYRIIRMRGWLRGCARLITLRFFDPRYVNHDSSRGRLYMGALAMLRLLRVAHLISPGRRRSKR